MEKQQVPQDEQRLMDEAGAAARARTRAEDGELMAQKMARAPTLMQADEAGLMERAAQCAWLMERELQCARQVARAAGLTAEEARRRMEAERAAARRRAEAQRAGLLRHMRIARGEERAGGD